MSFRRCGWNENLMVQLLLSHPVPPRQGPTAMNGLGTRLRSSHQLHLHRYDLYDIAYLAGGHVRVADTAVVTLVERGRIRVLPDGRLVVVELRRRHPVEAAALDAIGGRGWGDDMTMRQRLLTDQPATPVHSGV